MPQRREPDAFSHVLAHALVGGLVAYAFGRGRSSSGALVVGILGIMVHAALDAPVAKQLSDLGI